MNVSKRKESRSEEEWHADDEVEDEDGGEAEEDCRKPRVAMQPTTP